jgi:DNA helicase-2/ATP-dependent DNA helicase PcrA
MDKDSDENDNKITLMTVHASKGLEFKNVFVVGLEEQLFPSQMCQSTAEVEEERRLLYVAITRAEENCFLSYAKSRFRNGETQFSNPSRFFNDIDAKFLQKLNEKTTFFYQKPEKKVFFGREPQETKDFSRFKSISSLEQTSNSKISNISSSFKVGDRVLHAVFGEGTVVSVEGSEANEKARVNFDSVGEKQLLLKYARLTIIT